MIKRTKFGATLARVRKAKGLSQKMLGRKSGIHHITIARLEAGNVTPRAETVRLLAGALALPIKRLAPAARRASAK